MSNDTANYGKGNPRKTRKRGVHDEKLFYVFAIALVLTPVFAFAQSETIEGKFMGANCMFFNKSCPMDMTEGHIATEPDFVVGQSDGKYFYVTNIDRAIKARHLHEDVRVTGKLKDKASMFADSLEVKKNGKYVMIWSLKKQMEEMEKAGHGR